MRKRHRFGAGTIGIAVAIGLIYFSCKEVMICNHSDFRLEKAKNLGFATCNNSREDLKEATMVVFCTTPSRFGPTANVPIYIDATGAEPILELYQSIGKIESRMVAVAVRVGKRPVDVLEMTYSQHALIGSRGYDPEDVENVIAVMVQKKRDIEFIITDEFPQELITQAIKRAAAVDHALNVVIRY